MWVGCIRQTCFTIDNRSDRLAVYSLVAAILVVCLFNLIYVFCCLVYECKLSATLFMLLNMENASQHKLVGTRVLGS